MCICVYTWLKLILQFKDDSLILFRNPFIPHILLQIHKWDCKENITIYTLNERNYYVCSYQTNRKMWNKNESNHKLVHVVPKIISSPSYQMVDLLLISSTPHDGCRYGRKHIVVIKDYCHKYYFLKLRVFELLPS
jgi:hypothetical protein